MNAFLALLLFALMVTPGPSGSPPLPVITTVKASSLCAALRKNVFTAIGGMIANDSLTQQGGVLLQKVRKDAIADPESIGATGGAGASSELDDMRLQQLVIVLAKNIEKIEAQLSDPSAFPRDRPLDDRLARVQARLLDVLEQQKAELNVLSETVATNQATDLQSRRDPIRETKLQNPPTKRVSYVEALRQVITVESTAEARVTPEVNVLVDACR